jgi:tRNA(Arg) A34 adenosine deaminase TadA
VARPNVTSLIYDKKGNLLAVGRNSYVKTHPLQAKAASACGMEKRIFLHAEIHALTQVKDWQDAYRLVVIRMGANGEPLCSKPCPICNYVIKQTGIKKVEHT